MRGVGGLLHFWIHLRVGAAGIASTGSTSSWLCCKPHHLSDVVATAGVLLQCDSCNNICIKHHSLELGRYCQPHLADVPCSSKEEQQIATVNITTNLGNMFTHWDSSNSNICILTHRHAGGQDTQMQATEPRSPNLKHAAMLVESASHEVYRTIRLPPSLSLSLCLSPG